MVQAGELASEQFHAAVGRALMRWRRVEIMTYRVLWDILTPLDGRAIQTIWNSAGSWQAQRKLVSTLIKDVVASEKASKLWAELQRDLESATSIRNHLAHSDVSFMTYENEPGLTFGLTDPKGRSSPVMTKEDIDSAGKSFGQLASRIEALLAPTPLLWDKKPKPPPPYWAVEPALEQPPESNF